MSRRFTLIVMGHGRWQYFEKTCVSISEAVGPNRFDRTIVSLDGVDPFSLELAEFRLGEVEVLTTGPERQGLTANLAQAWGALTDDDEWVFHVEEDFLIRDAPLDRMADTLDAYPSVANMVLVRQPWNDMEKRAGSVLYTIPGLEDMGGWLHHRKGFWLNPMVAHANTLRQLQPGVEQALTRQCLDQGWGFGYWGSRTDQPRCTHIGAEGGMGSPLWRV